MNSLVYRSTLFFQSGGVIRKNRPIDSWRRRSPENSRCATDRDWHLINEPISRKIRLYSRNLIVVSEVGHKFVKTTVVACAMKVWDKGNKFYNSCKKMNWADNPLCKSSSSRILEFVTFCSSLSVLWSIEKVSCDVRPICHCQATISHLLNPSSLLFCCCFVTREKRGVRWPRTEIDGFVYSVLT